MSERRVFYRIIADDELRLCYSCDRLRRHDEFVVDRSRPQGRGSRCKECDRERVKEYYRENRERVLAKAAAKRGPAAPRHCSECGVELEGLQRVTCGERRCRDARFKRTNPEAYAAREAAKVVRRRERRREAAA